MLVSLLKRKKWIGIATALSILSVLLLPTVAFAQSTGAHTGKSAGFYQQVNLVSNMPKEAPVTDPNLDNAWGLAAGPNTPWWVSDNDTGVSTLYTGQGQIVPLVVTVPTPAGSPASQASSPSGVVFNGTPGFVVSQNGVSGPSLFIFDTEDGTISGWNPQVNRTHAILTVDHSNGGQGAVYKGLAIATNDDGTFIFATNFRAGVVEEYNSKFQLVRSFTDPILARICPFFKQCFAPFGIQAIGNKLYVTFALQDAQKANDVAGRGLGIVDVFSTEGRFLDRLAVGGSLNAPWGLALAPANFGRFSNDLLVGNFGDGHINVFDPESGEHLGQLRTQNGKPLVISGLWALEFGTGGVSGATNQLFFTDGPDGHGLFGFIESHS